MLPTRNLNNTIHGGASGRLWRVAFTENFLFTFLLLNDHMFGLPSPDMRTEYSANPDTYMEVKDRNEHIACI